MLKALNFLPQPTIAKIQGAAFGGAVGLAPAMISPYVVGAMGLKACRRYFLTAERFLPTKRCNWV